MTSLLSSSSPSVTAAALPPRSASVSSAPGGVTGPDAGGGGGLPGHPQQYCLRWNNHQHNLLSVFEDLLHNEAFVDVTLACDGMQVRDLTDRLGLP